MELRICHLYPELLNLNGDPGNVMLLSDRAKRRGIAVSVSSLSFGERFSAADYDLVFLGNGQDEELSAVLKELQNDRAALKAYIEDGGVLLAVCGGYEMLGEYTVTADGTKTEGLSLLPIHTTIGEKRRIGNAVVRNGERLYIGFENHAGRTDIGGLSPLGEVLLGFGNGETGYEGCRYQNVVGTYLHGPFLSKCPEMADELLAKALSRRYGEVTLAPLPDTFEQAAKDQLLRRFFPETEGAAQA